MPEKTTPKELIEDAARLPPEDIYVEDEDEDDGVAAIERMRKSLDDFKGPAEGILSDMCKGHANWTENMECKSIYIYIYISICMYISRNIGGQSLHTPTGAISWDRGYLFLFWRPFYR